MPIRLRQNSISTGILLFLDAAEEASEIVFSNPHQWMRWSLHGKHTSHKTTLNRLMDAGLIEIIEDGRQKQEVLHLTREGRMHVLMAKALMPHSGDWDGKWRVVFFDIPEENKVERQQLRRLLVKNQFKKMQASVYVSPWPLNREAVQYLKQTGFINYIRFGRLEELDDDRDLRMKFSLKD